MKTLRIKTAKVFEPLLAPAPYKAAYGGRGSGKSHFFGESAVEDAMRFPGDFGEGMRMVCIREVQKTLASSSKQIISDKIAKLGLGEVDGFRIYHDRIQTPKDGIIIFNGMTDHTAESIKSLEGFKRAWIDEAQSLTARSLSLLRPTIHRWDDAEIWASWNPRRKSDAIDDFFRGPNGPPPKSIVVNANWRDNPFWSRAAEEERQLELKLYPERYPHTYEGEYAKAFEGAYFAAMLAEAKLKGRIVKNLSADPLLPLRIFIDIGGAGASADAFTMWVEQWVEDRILVLDYYESVGQVLATHVHWLRSRGYEKAQLYLPHDGVATNNITGKRYEDHLREAGFATTVIPNQGRGAAAMRIEAVRRLAPKIWFDEERTEPGREALGFYHEKRDTERNIGLGPEHDWSSHGADSFGLGAVCYEPPAQSANFGRKINYGDSGWR
ncbi:MULTISPECIES: phage terminase large subunit [unclassified Bradyrhizobium]|uniref:phage terminase large subunit n=2 Tax=Bradyrhizobium TaxID=374 RepID=UPI0028E7AC81|nr:MULTISPECIES: phage terminase large subunit [unclassified Bradyrhizobium]